MDVTPRLALARKILGDHVPYPPDMIKAGMFDTAAITQAILAAIDQASELAARQAESDTIILSESRKFNSFGWTRKNHGEIIAAFIRSGEHLTKGDTNGA